MVWRALLDAGRVPPEVLEPYGHTQSVGEGCRFIAYYIRAGKPWDVLRHAAGDRISGLRKAGRSRAIRKRCAKASLVPSRDL